jgi:hypothetical protein
MLQYLDMQCYDICKLLSNDSARKRKDRGRDVAKY